MNKEDHIHIMRHSLAHILANAIQKLWPEVKFGVGPVVENGFYYDIDLSDSSLSDNDLGRIEQEMTKIIKADEPFEKIDMGIDEAIEWATSNSQPYKLELLNDLKKFGTTSVKDIEAESLGLKTDGNKKVDTVTFYRNGDFTDLCKGPHVSSTKAVGAFKLTRISGAYWRGNDKNPQMQRIYGVAFNTGPELNKFLEDFEESKKRDHRKLGQELDLFVYSDLVGPGLPVFTPRGTVIRDELDKFSQELQAEGGYERVTTPHIARIQLYKTSGHYDKYPERFEVRSNESDDQFMMKPMSCPHHIEIYSSRPRSYRELPLRYMESAMVYRDEKAGELHGLSRVRSATQDDGHAFVREDQVEDEFKSVVDMVEKMYTSVLKMPFRVRLAFRDDSDKYLGNEELWAKTQDTIKKITELNKLDYVIEEGEATFYGPKIEFVIRDALGRENQCATIQLDITMPERFNLRYVAEDGSLKMPIIVHKALLGSIERFMSVYIEHTGGRFPVWLAPEQIRLLTVNQEPKTTNFAEKIHLRAKELNLRLKVDSTNESIAKKIRNAELMKVPYVVVVGDKEIQSGELKPRIRADIDVKPGDKSYTVEEFLVTVANEAKTRASKTSL